MNLDDFAPKILRDAVLELSNKEHDWLEIRHSACAKEGFTVRPKIAVPLMAACSSAADLLSLQSLSTFIADGPKIFQATDEQCSALEQVEVNIPASDYAQPYQAIYISPPRGRYRPFKGVVCFQYQDTLTFTLLSEQNKADITTTIRPASESIEEALNKYNDGCEEWAEISTPLLRVAVNVCLALVNYGSRKEYLLKKNADIDRKLAKEQSERGERARQRLHEAIQVVSFSQDVKLHDVKLHDVSGSANGGEGHGGEKSVHWRRGHWRIQAHGPKFSLHRRIFVKPVLVRADLFIGEKADTQATYHR